MPRFFVKDVVQHDVRISGADAVHIGKSLRCKVGENITVCDGLGIEHQCEIAQITKDEVLLHVKESSMSEQEPSLKITLYQGITKGDKMELIIQKATELGCHRFVPVYMERCVSRPDAKSMAKKIERWQKIAAEAAGQSHRGKVPEVASPVYLKEATESLEGKSIVCYEGGGTPLRKYVEPNDSNLNIFIGPEGGFEIKEIEHLKSKGVEVITLGKRILRTETAPLCAISAAMLLTKNLD